MGNSLNIQKLLKSSRDQRTVPKKAISEKVLCVFVDHPYIEEDMAVPVLAPIVDSTLLRRRSQIKDLHKNKQSGDDSSSHKQSAAFPTVQPIKLIRTGSQIFRSFPGDSRPVCKVGTVQALKLQPNRESGLSKVRLLKQYHPEA